MSPPGADVVHSLWTTSGQEHAVTTSAPIARRNWPGRQAPAPEGERRGGGGDFLTVHIRNPHPVAHCRVARYL